MLRSGEGKDVYAHTHKYFLTNAIPQWNFHTVMVEKQNIASISHIMATTVTVGTQQHYLFSPEKSLLYSHLSM